MSHNWSPPPLLSPNVDVIHSSEMAAVVSLSSKPKRGLTLSREKPHADLGPNLGFLTKVSEIKCAPNAQMYVGTLKIDIHIP